MKTLIQLIVIALFVCVGVTTAFAYPVEVGDSIEFHNGLGTTSGGEFEISYFGSDDILFSTFCLERNESVSWNTEFKVVEISDSAVAGGYGGAVNGADPISDETKWLYWNFTNGTLDAKTDYTYTTLGINALQRAFWVLEEELFSTSDSLANSLIEAAISAVASGEDLGNVAVMNVTYLNGTRAQSQLIAGSAPVPEPATLVLLGSGLAGLAFYRRRMKK